MMFPFFSVVGDKSVDPRKVIRVRVAAPDGAKLSRATGRSEDQKIPETEQQP